ncbi:MAG: hypothetical protein H6729_05790 [Deltaproteobacteria bacterium]|nr:hypothetical protein [Deltaproteobacteria bacterium]
MALKGAISDLASEYMKYWTGVREGVGELVESVGFGARFMMNLGAQPQETIEAAESTVSGLADAAMNPSRVVDAVIERMEEAQKAGEMARLAGHVAANIAPLPLPRGVGAAKSLVKAAVPTNGAHYVVRDTEILVSRSQKPIKRSSPRGLTPPVAVKAPSSHTTATATTPVAGRSPRSFASADDYLRFLEESKIHVRSPVQGNQSTVYFTKDGQHAIKVTRERSRGEVEALRTLTPGIGPKIHAAHEFPNGRTAILMERVDGDVFAGTLDVATEGGRRVATTTLSDVDSRSFATDLVEKLAHLDRDGWLAKDVHGGNVIVTRNGSGKATAKLIDLGEVQKRSSTSGERETEAFQTWKTVLEPARPPDISLTDWKQTIVGTYQRAGGPHVATWERVTDDDWVARAFGQEHAGAGQPLNWAEDLAARQAETRKAVERAGRQGGVEGFATSEQLEMFLASRPDEYTAFAESGLAKLYFVRERPGLLLESGATDAELRALSEIPSGLGPSIERVHRYAENDSAVFLRVPKKGVRLAHASVQSGDELALAERITDNVAKLHRAGWHHHELSRNNVLIHDGQPTFLGFDSARPLTEVDDATRVVGLSRLWNDTLEPLRPSNISADEFKRLIIDRYEAAGGDPEFASLWRRYVRLAPSAGRR